MPQKQSAKADNPEQHKRFIDMAREIEVDEQEGTFDRAFDRLNKKSDTKSMRPTPKAGSRGVP